MCEDRDEILHFVILYQNIVHSGIV